MDRHTATRGRANTRRPRCSTIMRSGWRSNELIRDIMSNWVDSSTEPGKHRWDRSKEGMS